MLTTSSKFALYTNVFLSCVSFSIVLPSLWPYLSSLHAQHTFLAFVVSTYSLGEALGALSLPLFTRLSTRATLVVATATGVLGSVLYVLAGLADVVGTRAGAWAVLLGRLLHGLWTGACQAAQQAYLAAVLPVHAVTRTTVALNAYACMGFVAGPAFGALCSLLPSVSLLPAVRIDDLTAPGYFVLLSGVVGVALLVAVFDETRDRASMNGEGGRAAEESLPEVQVDGDGERLPLLTKDVPDAAVRLPGLVVCNIAFFTHFYGFALQETVTTPLVQEYYNWTILTSNLLFTFAGICALFAFLILFLTTRYTTDRQLTLFSLMLASLGYLLLLSTPDLALPIPRFLLAFAIISLAFPVGRAVVLSLYTKLLPMRFQARGQGIILAVGAVARLLGPFWAVLVFGSGWGPVLVFGGTAIGFVGCAALVWWFYKELGVERVGVVGGA